MIYVINNSGTMIDFEAALMLMDVDIMHQLDNVWYDSDQDYFTAYEAEHLKKYGEEWELSKANPTY